MYGWAGLRDAMRVRGLPAAEIPSQLLAYVLAVDVAVAGWSVVSIVNWTPSGRDLGLLAMLLGIALVFELGASRFGRLQWRISADLKRDMSSVWAVAAAVVLSPAACVVLIVVLLTLMWWRQHRRSGQPFYRMWFATSANVAACLSAGIAVRSVADSGAGLPMALATAAPVLAAIVVHTAVNRTLITIALAGVGVRGRELLGTRDENLAETATLCLGGLVAVAALYEPWLTALVLVPMIVVQRASLVRELEAAAITDAKTGLLNAVAWEQLAQRELGRAVRVRGQLAVMIIDIDRFKSVNDRYGHLAGDKVLAGVARSIESSLRDYDGLGRFGGEEFVAVLPDAGEHDALVIAERVRLRVNELTVPGVVGGGEPVDEVPGSRLSISIGVAVLEAQGSELSDLLHAADQALYRAKWNGRNQVQLARRGDEVPEAVKL